jgi:protocatechuate 3,4-dioxygenase beta subunit
MTAGASAAGSAGASGGGTMMPVVAGPDVAWATGGTKAMMFDHPDPFADAMGASCMVYPAQTLGPCYAREPMLRKDISDGMDGLPTRISLLVTDGDCKPVPNASVDIWAAGPDGSYSAYASGTICNPGRMATTGQMFGRGVQMSDEGGRVNFDMVFPGWYRGRTLHIHFTIRMDGREYLTSQLYFDDTLVDEILAQGSYAARGRRDTTNQSDFIFRSGGATIERVVFQTAKRPDGSLHAWKVLTLA